MIKLLTYLVRMVMFFGAIGLIALTESAIRATWGDIVFVINSIFLLIGGDGLGAKINSYFNSQGQTTNQSGGATNNPS